MEKLNENEKLYFKHPFNIRGLDYQCYMKKDIDECQYDLCVECNDITYPIKQCDAYYGVSIPEFDEHRAHMQE